MRTGRRGECLDSRRHGRASRVVGQATLRNVAVDQLAVYWPENVGRNARAWVTEHLSDGQVAETRADLDIVVDREMGIRDGQQALGNHAVSRRNRRLPAADAEGSATPRGCAVRRRRFPSIFERPFRRPFRFRRRRFVDRVGYGHQQANIALRIDGPIPDAMRLIDHDPLRYAGKMGMNPDDTGGQEHSIETSFSAIKRPGAGSDRRFGDRLP